MVEVGRSRARDDAVKVFRIHLRRLETLSPSGRASDVIRIFGRLIVELIDHLFASNDSRMASAVHPVQDHLIRAGEPSSVERRPVVASIVTDRREAHARDVLHVDVVHTPVDTTIVGVHRAAVPCAVAFR